MRIPQQGLAGLRGKRSPTRRKRGSAAWGVSQRLPRVVDAKHHALREKVSGYNERAPCCCRNEGNIGGEAWGSTSRDERTTPTQRRSIDSSRAESDSCGGRLSHIGTTRRSKGNRTSQKEFFFWAKGEMIIEVHLTAPLPE